VGRYSSRESMSHPMSFKIESSEGVEYFNVQQVKPLGLDSFNSETAKIIFFGERFKFTGNETISHKGQHYIDVKHSSKFNMFVLCSGGWMPPSYVMGKNYVVDRNVLSYITENKSYECFLNWFNVIKSSNDIKFSAIFSAIERNSVLIGSKDNYLSNVIKDKEDLEEYFSKDASYQFNNSSLSKIYDFVKKRTTENILDFLIDSVKFLVNKTKESERLDKAKLVFQLAKKYKVKENKLVVILCVSCLYSKSYEFSRKIIKPSKTYGKAEAINCINDTLFIDFIMLSKKYFSSDFCGVTADKNLALFWCALNPELIDSSDFTYQFNLSEELFNTASKSEIEHIVLALEEL
jgi:hypothetical protein